MELADVITEYRYCSFCGDGIKPASAYRLPDSADTYHSRECYEFSLRYPGILARLEDASG